MDGILPAEFRFHPSRLSSRRTRTSLAGRREHGACIGSLCIRDAARRGTAPATGAARAADAANASLRPWVNTLAGVEDEYSRRAVPLLAGGVGLVFLVLCANVCGLLLARMTARRREFSMRAALGASRGRLIRQAIVESCLLGTIDASLGPLSRGPPCHRTPLRHEDAAMLNPFNLDARALVGDLDRRRDGHARFRTPAGLARHARRRRRVAPGRRPQRHRGARGACAHARAAGGGSGLRLHAAGRRDTADADVREPGVRRAWSRDLRSHHAVAGARRCRFEESSGGGWPSRGRWRRNFGSCLVCGRWRGRTGSRRVEG